MAASLRSEKWQRSFPYAVDYNDHFETPLIAYQDILPLLDWLVETSQWQSDSEISVQRSNVCIYDPYYCNGKAEKMLRQLGFEKIIHAPRDFYQDIEKKRIPNYDILITNPPYSDQHKDACLSFCFQQLRTQGKVFFVLMPNYVAARNYYREHLYRDSEMGEAEDVCYIIPSDCYEYEHPEGTGHDAPPFASLWYCGIGKDRVENFQKFWLEKYNNESNGTKHPRLAVSIQELQQYNAIPTLKRPNPRRRRKMQQRHNSNDSVVGRFEPKPAEKAVASAKSIVKSSKYRSVDGKRTRKRF